MLGCEKEQRSLTREQKEAVGILSLGTFLEYFDLMIYVHMTVLLNELFFPKADTKTAAIYNGLKDLNKKIVRFAWKEVR